MCGKFSYVLVNKVPGDTFNCTHHCRIGCDKATYLNACWGRKNGIATFSYGVCGFPRFRPAPTEQPMRSPIKLPTAGSAQKTNVPLISKVTKRPTQKKTVMPTQKVTVRSSSRPTRRPSPISTISPTSKGTP